MATKKTTTAKDTKKATKAVKEEAKKVEEEVKKVEKKAVKETKPAAKKAEKAVKETKKETKKAAKPAAKKPAKKAAAPAVKGMFFEFAGKQVDASTLAQTAKDAYKANGGKGSVRSLELYVKAEDNALYYVINGKETGKVEL